MTFFSRKTDYALLILHALAGHSKGMSAREIASLYGIGRPFVANILKLLCSSGMIVSHRGANGGYALARSPAMITLDQVFDACDEPFQLTDCTQPMSDPCSISPSCPLKHAMGQLHDRVKTLLRNVNLQEFFQPTEPSTTMISIGLPRLKSLANAQFSAEVS
jgi:Rrf2 family protein